MSSTTQAVFTAKQTSSRRWRFWLSIVGIAVGNGLVIGVCGIVIIGSPYGVANILGSVGMPPLQFGPAATQAAGLNDSEPVELE